MKITAYILSVIGLLFSVSLKAQIPTNQPQNGSGFPTSGFPPGTNLNGFPDKNPDTKTKRNSDGRVGLDDSTKVVYGPTSTKFFLEEDVFNNRKKLYNIDTTMNGIHNYNFVQRYGNQYQDLGNIGTAIRPIFYQAPNQIGTLLGYDSYSLYAFKPNQVRYYNTKSPFSNIIYVPGGGEQDLLQFELSRNIDSLWNVGINVQRISANKQLIDRTSANDNTAVGHWDFVIHSNYQTKSKKYSLLAYFNLSDHNSNDQGGVIVDKDQSFQTMLTLTGNRPLLAVAATRDKSYNLHVYHEYAGYKAFQIYQVVDYQSRKAQFLDKGLADGIANGFYPKVYGKLNIGRVKIFNPVGGFPSSKLKVDSLYYYTKTQSDSLYNETRYSNFEHKSGIKGFYKGFNYRLHIRQRFFSYQNPFSTYQELPVKNPLFGDTQLYQYTTDTAQVYSKNENFLGLWLNQYFKDSTRVFGEFEYLLGKKDFKLEGEYQGKWLNLGGSFISSSPTLMQQATFMNGSRWDKVNAFSNVSSINIFGYTSLKIKQLTLHPSVNISKISDYIYFDTLAFAKQNLGESIWIYRAGLGFDYSKGKFSTTNQLYLSSKTDEFNLIRIPQVFFNSRLAYDLLFKKKLYIQTGIELHYKSGYRADAYMPATQQFHLQDKQPIEGYLQADVFADLRINRVRLFFKFAHVNQGLFNGGYYAAPGFAGMGRVLAYGVNWLLFD